MQEDNYLYMYIQSQLYKHLIIWTPYYYAQFALSLGERKLLHFLCYDCKSKMDLLTLQL